MNIKGIRHHAPSNRSQGALFEQMLQWKANIQNVMFIKIPDGCKRVPSASKIPRLIPVTTPFDFIFIYEGKSIFLDAKTFDKTSITYSMLTNHQVITLNKIRHYGAQAGYIVFHRDIDEIRFYDAEKLYRLRPRESLTIGDGIKIGTSESFNLTLLF